MIRHPITVEFYSMLNVEVQDIPYCRPDQNVHRHVDALAMCACGEHKLEAEADSRQRQ